MSVKLLSNNCSTPQIYKILRVNLDFELNLREKFNLTGHQVLKPKTCIGTPPFLITTQAVSLI